MKRIISAATGAIVACAIFSSTHAFALDTLLIDMRDRILEESKQITSLIADSKDIIALNSIWGSCIVTTTQLNGYFFMLGIFNTIAEGDLTEESIGYLTRWLEEIQNTNTRNISNLKSLTEKVDAKTMIHVEKLRIYYEDLNRVIDSELKKISLVKTSLTLR